MVEHSGKILASEEKATTTNTCRSYEVHSLQACTVLGSAIEWGGGATTLN